LFIYGLQHVMSMYAGVVAVPLIVGGALGLPFRELSYLITAALLISGLATLLQTLGIWRIGARLPIVQGTSFAAVASMLAIGEDAGGGEAGLRRIFGAVVVAGIIGFLLAPVFNQLLHFFPPVVTGSVITVIGISLLPVAVRWAGGGAGSEDFGAPSNIVFPQVHSLRTSAW
jgi:uric acid transporter